jgi:hypothetical protein
MPDAPVETEPLPEAQEPAPVEQPSPDPDDKPLGEAGQKALRAEREARKAEREARVALEQQLAEMAPLLELVKGLRGAVPGVEPSDTEKLAAELEQIKAEAAAERLGRLRLEVATAKGLTAAQAARLQGSTAEELEADADALLALFPTQTTPDAPQGRRGDPAQGARPGGTSGGLQSGAARYEARKKQPPTY